ncbi:MAG: ABC transporter ATP-binding protein, partial [Muribaculum sp.]|nr:ABC transporter ATP-binding protein [Muribaculum sp.]
MKEIWSVIRRFVAPYKLNVTLNIFFNFIAAFLTLFSFAVIIPILEMLFGIHEAGYSLMDWSSGSFKEVAFNNFYYYTQEMIQQCGQSGTLALLGALLVTMTAIKSLAYYMGAWFIIPMRNGIVRNLRKLMYDKITRLPLAYFTESRKGDVMARMTGDVTQIEVSIMSSLDMFFKNPVIILVCLTMMIFISWQLTVFVLVLLPIAGYLLGLIGKQLKSQSFRGQTQWGVLMSNIEETLGGLRIIKAFNAEKKVNERFDRENQAFYRISNKIGRRESLAHPVSETLGTLIIAIVLWFGGTLIINHVSNITAASFIY